MSLVSISEAARLTGKSTKTLYRMVSQGKLSVSHGENDVKTVEISELVRVFGENLKQDGTRETVSMSQRETTSENIETVNVSMLETRIDALKAEIAARDALLEAKDKHIASLDTALRLLAAPKTEKAPAPVTVGKPVEPVRRRWWQAR